MLRIEDLSFSYGDNEPLLHNVRFDFGDRGIVGIFGISGVGKTTLLKILAGLLYTPTWKVWRGDQDILQLDKTALYAYRNKTIGFAFQDHHLLGHFSARENIMLPFLFDNSQVDEGWIRHLTEYLGIMHLMDQKVHTISGGEKKELGLSMHSHTNHLYSSLMSLEIRYISNSDVNSMLLSNPMHKTISSSSHHIVQNCKNLSN